MKIQVNGINDLKIKYSKLFPKIIKKLELITQQEIKKNIKPFSDTGKLEKSIKVNSFGGKINVYSNVPYANIQNLGGTYKPTEKQKSKFWSLFYSTHNDKYKAMALSKSITVKAKHYTTINDSILTQRLNKYINTIIK